MHIPAADAAVRFSNRVTDYVRARPGYPPELLSLLQRHCGLTTASVVADIGSGTGLLTTLLLEAGCRVFGVEPNREMREAGTQALQRFPAFVAVEGSAETTTLPDATIDVVTAAQAFHWFDRIRARAEFARILKPGGWVVLIWNDRRV
ncbi:MAG: class I SAM-dependent methyltransferase, partial [Burkholderiales bacterium]|nr:class I SAM-dependent methyltransferase [Burkholderiales bacterium]